MPLGFAEVVRGTVKDNTIGGIVKVIVATADTLVARLQQVLMLVNHAKTEVAIHRDYELGECHTYHLGVRVISTC